MKTKSILLLDNATATESSLRIALEEYGRLIRARSILEGLVQVAQMNPDVVLVEWHLPDGTAPDFLRELRAAKRNEPVIVVSPPAGIERAVAAIRNGADDYLHLPVSSETLNLALKKAVDLRSPSDQAADKVPDDTIVQIAVGTSLRMAEAKFIEATLRACGNSIPRAAKKLGVSPSTLYRKRIPAPR